MQQRIEGLFGEHIAHINFNETADRLQVKRSVSSFTVEIPIAIEFGRKLDDRTNLTPYLNNLWGEVFVAVEPNMNRCVGKILQMDFKYAFRPDQKVESRIEWSGNLAELAFFEKVRNGGKPEIQISAHGELYYLVGAGANSFPELRSQSKDFWLSSYIEFPKDIWVDRLRKINFLENILLEIPLPTSPPSSWDEVWAALIDARDSFEQGGSTAWKNCIVAVRLALEKWQAVEKEKLGVGGHKASYDQRKSRTKAQRLDNIRWHLLQYAHFSAHTHADEWTRQDALLMISTLSALLSIRNP